MKICASDPLPSIDSLLTALRPNLTWPPVFPHLPQFVLPTLPSPLFPSIHIPNIELPTIIIGLQQFQLLNTALMMIKPLIKFLGLSLSAILPPFPGLPGIDLLSLLAGPPEFFINAIKKLLLSLPHLPGLPGIPDLSYLMALIPTIPPIMFPSMGIPEFEIIKIAQHALVHYQNLLSNVIAGLIKKVTDKLKIPGMPQIPKMPTMPDIIAMLMAHLPHLPGMPTLPAIPSLSDLMLSMHIPNFDFSALFAAIAFPGLPAFPSLPLPFNPSFQIPDLTFQDFLSMLQAHFSMGIMKPIMDFIMHVLMKFIGFAFPKFCVTI